MPPLPELPDFGIFYPQFAVDCYHEPVECANHFLCIFLVYIARLVPDHFLPEHRGKFFNFRSPEFLRKRKTFDMIPCPVPCLRRWQGKMLCDQHDAGDEPVPELVYHVKMMVWGDKKS